MQLENIRTVKRAKRSWFRSDTQGPQHKATLAQPGNLAGMGGVLPDFAGRAAGNNGVEGFCETYISVSGHNKRQTYC